MYGVFAYIYHKNQPNVGKYTIHGSYGFEKYAHFSSNWVKFIFPLGDSELKIPPKGFKTPPPRFMRFWAHVTCHSTSFCWGENSVISETYAKFSAIYRDPMSLHFNNNVKKFHMVPRTLEVLLSCEREKV